MKADRSTPLDDTAASPGAEGSDELLETRAALTELVGKRFGKLPVEPFVELIIAHTPEADWPVRRAAMEALIRRIGFAKRDDTSVLGRPGRTVLGLYRVGSKGASGKRAARKSRGAGGRPAARSKGSSAKRAATSYQTELCSLQPLRTSCDCADFVRGSLGLCKHGWVVLSTLGPGAFTRVASSRGGQLETSRLSFDATAPLTGSHDRLARLTASGPPRARQRFVKHRPGDDAHWPAAKRLQWIEQTIEAIGTGQYTAEPAALRVLSEERTRAARLATNAQALRRAEATLRQLHRTLYDYQRVGVRQFLQTGRLLLADDMGLGKTTQAIACCHALVATGRVTRGLLVVPAALRSQWLREWQQTTTLELIEVRGAPEERARTYRGTKQGLLLIGYELLLRDLPHVQAFAPELVLLDEAQRIKNWATKSAVSVKSLDATYRLALTGTPMENRFEELASLMDFVDDTALEPKWRLVPWHSMSAGNAARGIGGVRNLSVLRERLGTSFLRRQRAEVLSQLPPRTDTRIAVELTAEQSDEHAALDRPIAVLVRKARTRPLLQAEFLRLMQLLTTQRMICNGLAQLNFDEDWPRCQATKQRSERFLRTLYTPKLIVFRELIEQLVLAQGRKVVVFSQWRKMLRLAKWAIDDLLEPIGKRAAFFTGGESRKQREHALVDFHDDPSAAILFLSDAGGVGLNLQRAASCLINFELPWNPAVLEQRIGRIYRLGQTEPVEVLNLVSEGGIESRIAQLVAQKQAVFSTLFDGTSDEVMFDGDRSFLAGVEKLTEMVPDAQTVSDEASDAEAEFEEVVATMASRDAEPPLAGRAPLPFDVPDTARDGAIPPTEPQRLASSQLASALASLSVERTASGGLRIEAPPQVAEPLAQLLEGLAASLRANTQAR